MTTSANVTSKTSYKGIERAAILILSLPEEHSQKIFEKLEPEEIKDISQMMVKLGVIHADYVEKLCDNFISEFINARSLVGSLETTERLLKSVLSEEEARQIINELHGPDGRNLWDKLSNINEELLASFLKNEYPQTVAVILSRIRSKTSAAVLALLPTNLADEVVLRMLRMEPVRQEILQNIENVLRQEFVHNLSYSRKGDNYKNVAEIFNRLDYKTEARLFKNLETNSPESAEKVRYFMFTFEDLAELDNKYIQLLIRDIERTKLALALKGVPDRIKNKFIDNLSKRAAKFLLDDMENMGLVRVKDVEAAQNEIIATAKEMAARNEIILFESEEQVEFVE